MRTGGTRIRINKSKLYTAPEKQTKAVTFGCKSSPDKFMICKSFEKHYEVLIMDESKDPLFPTMIFSFENVNDANKKFHEFYDTDDWFRMEA